MKKKIWLLLISILCLNHVNGQNYEYNYDDYDYYSDDHYEAEAEAESENDDGPHYVPSTTITSEPGDWYILGDTEQLWPGGIVHYRFNFSGSVRGHLRSKMSDIEFQTKSDDKKPCITFSDIETQEAWDGMRTLQINLNTVWSDCRGVKKTNTNIEVLDICIQNDNVVMDQLIQALGFVQERNSSLRFEEILPWMYAGAVAQAYNCPMKTLTVLEYFQLKRAEIRHELDQELESVNLKTGQKGQKGIQGSPGLPGLTGMKGYQGPPGHAGPPGIPGEDGLPGVQGHTTGLKGDRGVPGLMGPPGGLRQPPGRPGNPGLPGMQGEPGLPGLPGLRGPDGEKGDPFVGIPGPKGYPGEKGEKGQRGIDGMPGMDGRPGDRGRPGGCCN